MELHQGLKYQKFAILAGLLFVGVLCLAGAFQQWRTGETYGLSGKGRVYRSEEPGYFAMLFYARIILGGISVALGIAAFGQGRPL